jgi:thiamine pyrophosphokinase
VAGGEPFDLAVLDPLPPAERVIAADSGADLAGALGLPVDVVIGDLDSVAAPVLDQLRAAGTVVDRHPEAKDQTDLELALAAAMAFGATRIVVVGGYGGRSDHFVGNMLVLGSPAYAQADVEAFLGPARLWIVRRPAVLEGRPGGLISLFALHGPARDVWSDGLAFPLAGDTLWPGSGRGTSNVFTADTAALRLAEGCLLAIRP